MKSKLIFLYAFSFLILLSLASADPGITTTFSDGSSTQNLSYITNYTTNISAILNIPIGTQIDLSYITLFPQFGSQNINLSRGKIEPSSGYSGIWDTGVTFASQTNDANFGTYTLISSSASAKNFHVNFTLDTAASYQIQLKGDSEYGGEVIYLGCKNQTSQKWYVISSATGFTEGSYMNVP